MSAHVTDMHVYLADCAMYELPIAVPSDVCTEDLRDAIAQLIADAEARGRAEVSAAAMTSGGPA